MKAFDIKPDASAEVAAENEDSQWTRLDEQRDNNIKHHLHRMFVFSVWLGWGAIVVLGGVWLFHFVIPSKGWMSVASLDKIQWLFAGLIGSNLLQSFIQKRIK